MTDYFALLGEARRPWLDPEKLKEKYFARVREWPVDAELNEAFRVLSHPKLRLQHLLRLQHVDLNASREIPAVLAELFWQTGQLLREVDCWQLKINEANSALSRALLSGERLKLQEQIRALETRLNTAHAREIEQLQTIDHGDWPDDLGILLELHDGLSYLTRLRDQVKEKLLLLA
ncbi:MAG TPA: hypothetical protein VGI60_16815 [Chthoniobacterales bacterium]|jgi:hypothetical protein